MIPGNGSEQMRRSFLKCLAVFVLFLGLACGHARAGEAEDSDLLAEAFTVLSEESRRANKSRPPVVSSGNLTPFGKGERAIEFEDLAAAKMAFEIEMVVDRSMDRNEFL